MFAGRPEEPEHERGASGAGREGGVDGAAPDGVRGGSTSRPRSERPIGRCGGASPGRRHRASNLRWSAPHWGRRMSTVRPAGGSPSHDGHCRWTTPGNRLRGMIPRPVQRDLQRVYRPTGTASPGSKVLGGDGTSGVVRLPGRGGPRWWSGAPRRRPRYPRRRRIFRPGLHAKRTEAIRVGFFRVSHLATRAQGNRPGSGIAPSTGITWRSGRTFPRAMAALLPRGGRSEAAPRHVRISTAHSAPRIRNGPNGTYERRPIRRVTSNTASTTPASEQPDERAAQRPLATDHQPHPDEELHVPQSERARPRTGSTAGTGSPG